MTNHRRAGVGAALKRTQHGTVGIALHFCRIGKRFGQPLGVLPLQCDGLCRSVRVGCINIHQTLTQIVFRRLTVAIEEFCSSIDRVVPSVRRRHRHSDVSRSSAAFEVFNQVVELLDVRVGRCLDDVVFDVGFVGVCEACFDDVVHLLRSRPCVLENSLQLTRLGNRIVDQIVKLTRICVVRNIQVIDIKTEFIEVVCEEVVGARRQLHRFVDGRTI